MHNFELSNQIDINLRNYINVSAAGHSGGRLNVLATIFLFLIFVMLFSDDFVGASESREGLQKLIDVVYRYCNRWRLKANVGRVP